MATSYDINSLFICMALMVTFPYFVHHLLTTNIQRDEQAEGGDRPRNITFGRN